MIKSITKIPLYFFLLVLLYFYMYPTDLKTPSLSITRILQLIGLVIFLCRLKKIDIRLIKYFSIGILISVVGFIATCLINQEFDFYVIRTRGLLIFLNIFYAYFICYIVKKLFKKPSIYLVIELLIIIGILQAILSLSMFISPAAYDIITKLIEFDETTLEKSEFRLIAVGGFQYANAAIQYGILILMVLLLRRIGYGLFQSNNLFLYFSIVLFSIAGILSGRSFFLIIFIAILWVPFLYKGKTKIIVSMILTLAAIFIFCGSYMILYILEDNNYTLEWAFELFSSFNDTGQIETKSTDGLKEMWKILPESTNTWIFGDGKISDYYKDTDVGYLRSIFYWGVVGSLVYYLSKIWCYDIVRKSTTDSYLRQFFLLILIIMFVYNVKDFWNLDIYYILFLCSLVFFNTHDEPVNTKLKIHSIN